MLLIIMPVELELRTMDESSENTCEELTQKLRELKKLFIIKESGFPEKLIEHFVITNELFEKVISEFYWQHYDDRNAPPEGQYGTVMSELVEEGVLARSHVIELFDQYTTASFLGTPQWFKSQPNEHPFVQECIEKIPVYHASMVAFLKILEEQN